MKIDCKTKRLRDLWDCNKNVVIFVSSRFQKKRDEKAGLGKDSKKLWLKFPQIWLVVNVQIQKLSEFPKRRN